MLETGRKDVIRYSGARCRHDAVGQAKANSNGRVTQNLKILTNLDTQSVKLVSSPQSPRATAAPYSA